MVPRTMAFLGVSDGAGPVRYLAGGAVRTMPVFKVDAVDTLAAGDIFHAGIALALAEGSDEVAAMRFGAAAAALKCTRFGGSMGAPTRTEVEAFLARQA
jgi:sugar/nucleoside kinase (ribokinase family)